MVQVSGNKKLQVSILTPYKLLYKGDADSIKIPTSSGEIGVYPNHTEVISILDIGQASITNGELHRYFFINNGMLRIEKDTIFILAETAEEDKEIDAPRAEKAKERAEKRLKELKSDIDIVRAQKALRRATARIKMSLTK